MLLAHSLQKAGPWKLPPPSLVLPSLPAKAGCPHQQPLLRLGRLGHRLEVCFYGFNLLYCLLMSVRVERGTFKISTQTHSSVPWFVIYGFCFLKLLFHHVSFSLVPFDGLHSGSWDSCLVSSFIIKLHRSRDFWLLCLHKPPPSEQH